MAEIVEGTWKNFIFKMITPQNKTKVYNHLAENFYNDELMCKYFGGSTDLCRKEYETFYETVIPLNLSFYAEDKDTGEIAGVRMTTIQHQGNDYSNFKFASPQITNAIIVTNQVEEQANFFEKFGVNQVVNFVAASTARKYRGQGLATEMYRRSLPLFKAQGHPYAKCILSSPYTRKALTNLGFKEIARIDYKDFKREDGQQMFPDLQEGVFINWMYLEL